MKKIFLFLLLVKDVFSFYHDLKQWAIFTGARPGALIMWQQYVVSHPNPSVGYEDFVVGSFPYNGEILEMIFQYHPETGWMPADGILIPYAEHEHIGFASGFLTLDNNDMQAYILGQEG